MLIADCVFFHHNPEETLMNISNFTRRLALATAVALLGLGQAQAQSYPSKRIGFYNPIAKGQAESLRVAHDRLNHWTSVGAQCSPTVIRLVKQAAAKVAA
jgi:hypothetical protein